MTQKPKCALTGQDKAALTFSDRAVGEDKENGLRLLTAGHDNKTARAGKKTIVLKSHDFCPVPFARRTTVLGLL
ncbi:MAG: hypothetical protein IT327_13845 [Anaerolineae bacterium]|nr:hypothetical protein [Anaerolineae bacterium]